MGRPTRPGTWQRRFRQINSMRPGPDLVLITGDLVEHPGPVTYSHFRDLIAPLEMPVYLMPGNHDDPAAMCKCFCDTPMFPAQEPHYQYAIEGPDFRTLMLNSHFDDSELPFFGPRRLKWLDEALAESDQPTLVAIHHPPMKTGIGFIDMVGDQWYQGFGEVLSRNPQVLKVICGHGHIDLHGRIGQTPGADGWQHRPPVDRRPRIGHCAILRQHPGSADAASLD